jgi:hypothetical protein
VEIFIQQTHLLLWTFLEVSATVIGDMKLRNYIRCSTPDCDWSFGLPDLSAERIERCYAEFRMHCIERHQLEVTSVDSQMYLDFLEGTLTLIKQS